MEQDHEEYDVDTMKDCGRQPSAPCPSQCGNYTFEKYLGSGTYGQVYAVKDARDGKRYALKRVQLWPPDKEAAYLDANHGFSVDVIMELQTLKFNADHPNLVPIKELFFECPGTPRGPDTSHVYLVMELADQGDLAS